MTIAQADIVATSELSGSEWFSLIWGFLWRGIVYTVLCAIAGAIVGGVVGAVIGIAMGAVGAPMNEIRSVSGIVGAILGFGVSLVGLRLYIAWLLRSRYADLRLVLVRG